MSDTAIAHPPVVSRAEWLAARKTLLAEEKAFTKTRDALNAKRRRLPMVRVEKEYAFEGPQGHLSLRDLFEGRQTLIVYHFMFDPDDPPPGKSEPWSEGCSGCSHFADNLPHLSHLRARGVSFSLVSRARWGKIAPFKTRMGWEIPWVSSFDSDFNYDFHATTDEAIAPVEYNYQDKAGLEAKGHTYHMEGEQPGLSVFLKLGDQVFHTYSTYGRGLDLFINTHNLLDITPFGRSEHWEDSPPGWPKTDIWWLRHHDRYDENQVAASCCHS